MVVGGIELAESKEYESPSRIQHNQGDICTRGDKDVYGFSLICLQQRVDSMLMGEDPHFQSAAEPRVSSLVENIFPTL